MILKVLVPLAMPSIFNSLRLLFGLAFGYIMLAETIKLGGESGGLGDIINTSQRRGPREHIILVLLIIPLVALAIDRALFWIQRELFPYRYGGAGMLNQAAARWRCTAGRMSSPRSGGRPPRPCPGRLSGHATDGRHHEPGPSSSPTRRVHRSHRSRWAWARCWTACAAPTRSGCRTSSSSATSPRPTTRASPTSSRRSAT